MSDIDKACEKVYEAITGKCAHSGWRIFGGFYICRKCNYESLDGISDFKNHIFLKDDLNYWLKVIFSKMTPEQLGMHEYMLDEWADPSAVSYLTRTPLHHLEAALCMLGEDELAEKVREYEKDNNGKWNGHMPTGG